MSKPIDFSQKPTHIVPYNFGDVVTRENFIHYLVLSYALSRGSFVIQNVFFWMMQEKSGFSYEETIKNFYDEGSFDALSEEEQAIFVKAFRSVKKHMDEYIEMEIEDEIRDEVGGLYDRPKSNGSIPLNAALTFFEFDKITSVPEFLTCATEFNKRYEDSLN